MYFIMHYVKTELTQKSAWSKVCKLYPSINLKKTCVNIPYTYHNITKILNPFQRNNNGNTAYVLAVFPSHNRYLYA